MGGAACYVCSRLDLQTGACPEHRPFDWHWRWLIPTKLNPGLQKYCAREPTVLPLRRTCPFEGATKPPQFTMLSAFKRDRSRSSQTSGKYHCEHNTYAARRRVEESASGVPDGHRKCIQSNQFHACGNPVDKSSSPHFPGWRTSWSFRGILQTQERGVARKIADCWK